MLVGNPVGPPAVTGRQTPRRSALPQVNAVCGEGTPSRAAYAMRWPRAGAGDKFLRECD